MPAPAEHWQRIESLFAAVAEQPTGQRRVFLDAKCGDDRELRAELEQLLEADDRAGSFIEHAVEAQASSLAEETFDPRLGSRIGPYRLVRRIGRGGMSGVYLAVRVDAQFRKRVAVKVVRRGMDTDDILHRFRAERQILASLDHPNIAQLHDGGTTDDDLPYFVMEYIEGQPIDVYCDERQLPVRDRLILFRSVCAAVHYAHCNLVVHRDLKPSNILVTTDGVVKLLDFGIAKLLNPELAEAALAPTRNRRRPMTPDCASPEQFSGGLITTASDVYSLGVLLSKLLTGRGPHRARGSVEELERLVWHQAPEKPSEVAPEHLRRALRGDLDHIVLMALRKEPARRYGSVEQLAEDVHRHLVGRPVIARQDKLGYRLAKFVHRHRLGVATAALTAAVILALMVTLAVQSVWLIRERDRATQVSAMLNDLFEIADPGEVRGASITARELLDRGAERIEQLPDEPDTIMLLDTLARLYEELGLYPRSIPLRRRSLGITRSTFDENSPEVAAALTGLGLAFALNGSFAEAGPLFRQALGVHRQVYGDQDPRVPGSLNKLALVHHDLGEYRQARTLYEEGVELQLRAGVEAEERAASPLTSNLALLHHDLGNYRIAERMYRETAALRRRVLGEHPLLADSLDGLGTTLHARGALAETETFLRRALGLRLELLGDEDRDVARSQTHLGRLLCDLGRLAEAEDLLDRALEQRLVLLGEHHPEVAATLESMAVCQAAGGELEEAEGLYRRALTIYRASMPEAHPLSVDILLELADLLQRRGESARAEVLLRQAVAIRQRALPEGSWQLAEARSALGGCLAAQGQRDEARRLLAGTGAPLVAQLGTDHLRTQRVLARLAID